MKKMLILVAVLVLSFIWSADISAGQYGYMKANAEFLKKWKEADAQFPRYRAPLKSVKKGAVDLLSHFNYSATLRDQGNTGTCWSWATQAVMSIDLDVKEGIKLENGFSVQFIISNGWMIGATLNSGGTAEMAQTFYEMVGYNVPWNNTNAEWTDGDGNNNTKSAWIYSSPNQPLSTITVSAIETFGASVTKEQAIANVKSVLDNNQPLWFAYYLATGADWDTFGTFWSDQAEAVIIDLDYGQDHLSDDGSGGHAVACVGYNDDDPDPAKHYWIMLNSWGNADGNRPNGTFRMAMDTNYNAIIKDENSADLQMFWWYKFDTNFTDAVAKGVAAVSSSLGNAKANADTVKIINNAYSEADPESIFAATMYLNGFEFSMDSASGAWTQSAKGFSYKSLKKATPQITLTIDAKNKTWTFSMAKADQYRYLNPVDGFTYYLLYQSTDGGQLNALGGRHAFMLDEIIFKSSSNFKN